MSTNTPDAWFTTPEAAHHLKLSRQYLEKLRCWGGGPKFSVLGRRVVYMRSNLDAWAIDRSRTSTSDTGKAA
jgi:hypothetical protein